MSKDKKSKHRKPNLSPSSALRPRLEGLLRNPGWFDRGREAINADLAAISKGVDPAETALVLVGVMKDSPGEQQPILSEVFAGFLRNQGSLETIVRLASQRQLPFWAEETIRHWLQDAGLDVATIPQVSTFFRGFRGVDEFGSQGVQLILWYSNRQHSRAAGMGMLLDFNPPWVGCAKDCHTLSQDDPDELEEKVTDFWQERGLALRELDAYETKRLLIEALLKNREQGIRLHRDFHQLRDKFAQHVLPLPDAPDSPLFTLADFDYLLNNGKSSEEINLFERRVGRRVRLEDGKELFIGADPDEFDDL